MVKAPGLNIVANLVGLNQQLVINNQTASSIGFNKRTTVSQAMRKLKGSNVAVLDVGGSLQDIFNVLARRAGVSPSSYAVSGIAPYSSELAALEAGHVAAAMVSAPYGTLAAQAHQAVMVDDLGKTGFGKKYNGVANSGVIVRTAYAKAHPSQVEAMYGGIARALTFMAAEPKAAVAILHKQFLPSFPVKALSVSFGPSGIYPATPELTPAVFAATRAFTGDLINPAVRKLAYKKVVWSGAR